MTSEVRIPRDQEVGGIHSSVRGTIVAELTGRDEPAQRVRHLDVDEMRSMQVSVPPITGDPGRRAPRG